MAVQRTIAVIVEDDDHDQDVITITGGDDDVAIRLGSRGKILVLHQGELQDLIDSLREFTQ